MFCRNVICYSLLGATIALGRVPATNQRPPEWSNVVNDLKVRVEIGAAVRAGDVLDVRLFAMAASPSQPRLGLVAGRICWIFVRHGSAEAAAMTTVKSKLNGPNGIDEGGKQSIAYKVAAPQLPGTYSVVALVVATDDDVDGQTSIEIGGKSRHWTGAITTQPIVLEVVAGAPK
jgi:hypothetical protein